MKYNSLFSTLCATLLLSGCGSETNSSAHSVDKPTQSKKSPSITGYTTLANATLCLDENSDNRCSVNEPTATSSVDGKYTLILDNLPSLGSNILATKGDNLILLKENSDNITLIAPYSDDTNSTNITTLTTLLSQAMKEGLSFNDAKVYIASRYNIDEDLIVANPLETLKDKSTELHFQTIHAMEEYQSQQIAKKSASSAPQRSGGFDLEIISFDEAETALDYINIFFQNVAKYTFALGLFTNFYIHEFLVYTGIVDSDEDAYVEENFSSVDVENLSPTLKKVYDNNLSAISREEIDTLIADTKVAQIDSKLLIDITTIANTSADDSKREFLASLLGSASTPASVEYLMYMLTFSTQQSAQVIGILHKAIKDIVYDNSTGKVIEENTNPLFRYLSKNYESRFAGNVAVSVFKIGKKQETYFLLNNIQKYYNDTSSIASQYLYAVRYIRSDAATQNVLDFYYDEKSSDEFKLKLRTDLSDIANDMAIEGLYTIASKVSDSDDFDNVVALFEKLKNRNPNAESIVKEHLYNRDIPFVSQELQDRIEAVFKGEGK